jgi:hypothetical protein
MKSKCQSGHITESSEPLDSCPRVGVDHNGEEVVCHSPVNLREFRRRLQEFKDNVPGLPECPSFLWKYYRPVKYLFQRLTRGFDETCLWGLDYNILLFIYPRLKALREVPPHGTPIHPLEVYPAGHDQAGDPRALTMEEWDSILGEILAGMKLVVDADCYPLDPEQHAQLEKSMDLFHQWFFALWD